MTALLLRWKTFGPTTDTGPRNLCTCSLNVIGQAMTVTVEFPSSLDPSSAIESHHFSVDFASLRFPHHTYSKFPPRDFPFFPFLFAVFSFVPLLLYSLFSHLCATGIVVAAVVVVVDDAAAAAVVAAAAAVLALVPNCLISQIVV